MLTTTMETDKTRSAEVIRYLNKILKIKQEDLRQMLGYKHQSNIANIMAAKNALQPEHLKILREKYNINDRWVNFGEGEMLLITSETHLPPDVIDLNNPIDAYSDRITGRNARVIVATVDSSGRDNIILVPARAAAGYAQVYDKPEKLKDFPAFWLPGNIFRGGTFRAFEIAGESMIPAVLPNSIVIGRLVDNWLNDITDGRMYVVTTNEGLVCKWLLNRIEARGQLSLQSENAAYYTSQLDINEVLEVWEVKAEIRFLFNKNTNQYELKVMNHDDEINYLKAELEKLKKDRLN